MCRSALRSSLALVLVGLTGACASNTPPAFTRVSASPQVVARGGLVQIAAPATDKNGDALKYAWTVSDGWTLVSGGDGAAVVKAPDTPDTQGVVKVTVDDGHKGTATASIAVATSKDHAPALSGVTATPDTVAPGATIALSAAATDADGDAVTYAWTAPPGWTLADGDKADATLTAPATYGTAGLVLLTVDDGQGGAVSGSVLVRTTADQAPVITALDATPNPVLPGGTVALSAAATSPTGNTVSYSWSLSGTGWTLTGADTASATLTAPAAYADSVIATVTADDGAGGTSTASVVVSTTADRAPVISTVTASPTPAVRGMLVALAAAAQDPDGDAFTYAWSFASTPTGSAATLSDPTAASPTFTPDVHGTYVVRLVATDTDGAASAPFDTRVVPANGTPTAVIAGNPPLAAVQNTDLTLDGSGSSTPAGDALTWQWAVSAKPAGSTATVTPVGDGATATFHADTAGTYTVALDVTDPWNDTGHTTTTVTVAGAAQLAIASGNNQSGEVYTDLAQPMVVQARTVDGAPVPGLRIDWSPAGGTLGNPSSGATDANGEARMVLRTSRIAGAGTLLAQVHGEPSLTATFDFTAEPGAPVSLNVSAPVGNADTGTTVSVRPVDEYGNPTNASALANGLAFRLDASGSATFATTATSGSLLAGGGTNQIDGQLVGGTFDIALTDWVAEGLTVTIGQSPGTTRVLGYTGWRVLLDDNAELSLMMWATDHADAPGFKVENGAAVAHGGSRSLGLDLAPSDTALAGDSVVSDWFAAPPTSLMKLAWWQDVAVASGTDATRGCTAQPDLYVVARSCNGYRCSSHPLAPRAGYPVTDACSGQPGFGTTSGWERREVDITDALAAGFHNLQFDMSNDPNAATPAAASHWWLDDLRVSYLAAGTTDTVIRPGAATTVAWTAGTYDTSGDVNLGACLSGFPQIAVTADIVDAYGNRTQDSQLAFGLGWGGSATADRAYLGSVVSLGATNAVMRFERGRASLILDDTTAESMTLTLTDPQGSGLTLGPDATAAFAPWACHYDGVGGGWSDTVPTYTFDATEATRACETRYGAGACTANAHFAFQQSPPQTCGSFYFRWTWADVSETDVCSLYSYARIAGHVDEGFWLPYGFAGTYYCVNHCGWGVPGGGFSLRPGSGPNRFAWY